MSNDYKDSALMSQKKRFNTIDSSQIESSGLNSNYSLPRIGSTLLE